MTKDKQVKELFKQMGKTKNLGISAARTGMDEKTARKYLELGKLPSEIKKEHDWRTREDPFEGIWEEELKAKLELNPGLEAKTLFSYLQKRYPGQFPDGQLRTLQRKIKRWRALEGPPKEVFFPQRHRPGVLSQSDFTHMKDLGISIKGEPFNHLLYHFVLTYSNWETGTICYSECQESLVEGFQNAVWELGGVPRAHQTDRLSAAVQKPNHPEEFTKGYQSLLDHYGIEGRKTQARSPHENGDIEQRHHRYKRALEQSLLLRGSRDFESLEEYRGYLKHLFKQLNAGRRVRLQEELDLLSPLPGKRLDSCRKLKVRVTAGSTVRVYNNVYSVNSRLIGELVDIRLFSEVVKVWYGQKCVEQIPRLRGDGKHKIQYRHIIDWLIKKPGAFENYKYREDLFPTSNFRMVYDNLSKNHSVRKAAKEYLRILNLAAKQSETGVNAALQDLLSAGAVFGAREVKDMVAQNSRQPARTEVNIDLVRPSDYNTLLDEEGA